jgi:5'-nucleotidase
LVDVIAAGHTHAGLGHQVNGIGIMQPFSRGQSFGRVDVVFDRRTRRVARIRPFAPHEILSGEYEGKAVTNDPAVVQAMAPALQRVHALQATPLGVSLDAPIHRGGAAGSPLGNLLATALRESAHADVAAINNADRGLRTDLAAGPLTFGRLYDLFPYDNRVARITLSGAQLAEWVVGEIRQGRQGGLGISGVEVRTRCTVDGLHADLVRGHTRIHDDDHLVAVTIGGPTPSGGLASSAPVLSGGPIGNAPLVRELIEDWFRRRENGALISWPELPAASPWLSTCPGDRRLPAASR